MSQVVSVEVIEKVDPSAVEVTAVEVTAVEETAAEVPAVEMMAVRKRKRKPASEAMTAAEATDQAEREGLVFITSANSVSGFYNVLFDNRGKNKPYSAYSGQGKGTCLGSFVTAEEAALAVARHHGNTTERCEYRGHARATRDALSAAHGLTVICRREGCGALVDLCSAKGAARGRESFAVGDGCGARSCTRNKDFAPGRFREAQCKMAQGLLDGRRRLMSWPARIQQRDNYDPLLMGDAATQEAAREVLASHGR